MSNNQELIKILSIDGGGIRGIIPSMVLAEIEKKTGKRIAEMFDLMAGTSAGGIITLGLNVKGLDGKPKFSAEEISNIFRVDGPTIFKKTLSKKARSIFGTIDERYDHKPLVKVLKGFMADKILKNSYTKTLISSYDIFNRHPQFFKSWRDEYNNVKMWTLARATSAAPTYFEPVKLKVNRKTAVLVDGGVFINNPAMSAYSEVVRLIKEKDSDGNPILDYKPILLVSIGTGEYNTQYSYEDTKNWGIIKWGISILDVVFDGVSDAVDYQLRRIFESDTEVSTDKKDLYYRLQVQLSDEMEDFDDARRENIEALENKAVDLINENKDKIDEICKIIS